MTDFKAKLTQILSPQKSESDGAIVSNDAITTNSESDQQKKSISVKQLESQTKDDCNECTRPFSTISKKGRVNCKVCDGEFCLECTNFTAQCVKNTIKREDVVWACKTCMPRLIAATMASPIPPTDTSSENPDLNASIIKTLSDSIPKMIENVIEQKIPQLVAQSLAPIDKVVEKSVEKSFNDTLLGNGQGNVDDEWLTVGSGGKILKPKATLGNAIKQAAQEQKMDETRKNNIIIYRAPESKKDKAEDKKKDDEDFVKGLLSCLDVNAKQTKLFRIGNRDDKNDDKNRPIKVVFKNDKIVSDIMSKAKNLRQADDKYKQVSISYDMNKEQQEVSRKLVNEAKELTKNSATYWYKVVGRPGEMKIKPIERK